MLILNQTQSTFAAQDLQFGEIVDQLDHAMCHLGITKRSDVNISESSENVVSQEELSMMVQQWLAFKSSFCSTHT